MPDFSSFASLVLDGRTYAIELAVDHKERFGYPPIAISMSQNMRSAVIAKMMAGECEFELDPEFIDSGRVAITCPDSGARFLLKSKTALSFEASLFDGATFDVSPDIVFLLAFEFDGSDLLLEVAPAQRVATPGRQRYQMLGAFDSVGRFSPEGPDADTTFGQDDSGDTPWWEIGFEEGDDETGSGS